MTLPKDDTAPDIDFDDPVDDEDDVERRPRPRTRMRRVFRWR